MGRDQLLQQLHAPKAKKRLKAVKKLQKLDLKLGAEFLPQVREDDANLHVHTYYSYSPYSPSQAAYLAYRSGLASAGIMDHDTLSGAEEFVKACKTLGLAHSVGFDFRVRLKQDKTARYPLRSDGYTYIAVYGIPKKVLKKVNLWLKEDREMRSARNRKFCDSVSKLFAPHGVAVDYDKDVLPLTKIKEDGSVTERHVLRAAATNVIAEYGKGNGAKEFLQKVGFSIDEHLTALLSDEDNPFYMDDLVTALKENAGAFGVGSRREAIDMPDVVTRLENFGAIVSYLYFGNLDDLVEGENTKEKMQNLVLGVKELGFHSMSVKVSRLSEEDLALLCDLCREHDILLLPGTAVNSPRQPFGCDVQLKPEFKSLADACWAVVGHGKMSDCNLADGMFSEKACTRQPSLADRITLYAEIGRKTC